jgi:hypothetical protein
MSKIAAVTTFNARGYETYGRRCIESFEANWPKDVQLHVYAENCQPRVSRSRVWDLHHECPKLVEFKEAHGHRATDNFRKDAVRFAHKVFAVLHAGRNLKVDRLFWIDADTYTFAPIPIAFLESCLEDGYYTSCLLRKKIYTECSFVGYAPQHPYHFKFLNAWERYYTQGEVFKLDQWHDCETYDKVRREFEQKGWIMTQNLSGKFTDTTHPFVNCVLGQYMDHLKGARKLEGRSRDKDLKLKRSEDYWR